MKVLFSRTLALSVVLLFSAQILRATVGPIEVGENMYQMLIRVANTEDIIEEKVCDSEESINDTLDKVCNIEIKSCNIEESVNDILDKACDIEESVNDTLDKVCDLHDCAPTPLSAPGTISAAGTYCMTQDIAGAFTFGVDGIHVDMNGFELDGTGNANAVTMASRSDCSLANGKITGATTNGVSISGGTRIALEGLDFVGSPTGVAVTSGASFVHIRDCRFEGQSSEAICFNATNSSKIIHCCFRGNTGIRVVVLSNATTACHVDNCFFGTCNLASFSFAGCVALINANKCTVRGNTFHDIQAAQDVAAIDVFGGVGHLICDNLIAGMTTSLAAGNNTTGIIVNASEGAIVARNKVTDLFSETVIGIDLRGTNIRSLVSDNYVELISTSPTTTIGYNKLSALGGLIRNRARVVTPGDGYSGALIPEVRYDIASGAISTFTAGAGVTNDLATPLHNLEASD